MSEAGPAGWPRTCSGDMYPTVPRVVPGSVSTGESDCVAPSRSVGRVTARPKSRTFTRPSEVRNRLEAGQGHGVLGQAGDRPLFVHCGSGSRVGGALLPHLMLGHGLAEEDATTQAMRMGLRSADLLDQKRAAVPVDQLKVLISDTQRQRDEAFDSWPWLSAKEEAEALDELARGEAVPVETILRELQTDQYVTRMPT